MAANHAFPVWARFSCLGWRVVGYVERSKQPETAEEVAELYSLAWSQIEQATRYEGYQVLDWDV